MNLEGTGPSKVVQSVVAEPGAAAIASAMSGTKDRLGRYKITGLIGWNETESVRGRLSWSRMRCVVTLEESCSSAELNDSAVGVDDIVS